MSNENKCKHNAGFDFKTEHEAECYGYPAIWRCTHRCGFFLNFDPAKYPVGLAYIKKPDPTKFQKVLKLTKDSKGADQGD